MGPPVIKLFLLSAIWVEMSLIIICLERARESDRRQGNAAKQMIMDVRNVAWKFKSRRLSSRKQACLPSFEFDLFITVDGATSKLNGLDKVSYVFIHNSVRIINKKLSFNKDPIKIMP